jgi:predicted phosphate transport protein (TIGR00153 family)
MDAISRLLGESPFRVLKEHAAEVEECVKRVRPLFVAMEAGDSARLQTLAREIFAHETAADDLRNQLHERLASKVLMPMRKEDLFNILEQQDSLADRAEDIAAVLTYRDMRLPEDLMRRVKDYLDRILQNCALAAGIMSKLDLLAESSFGGRDALTVSKLITELAEREDATKAAQIELTRALLAREDCLPPVETMLWVQVIDYIAQLSAYADRVGNGIRMTLRMK